jgi:zinc protease
MWVHLMIRISLSARLVLSLFCFLVFAMAPASLKAAVFNPQSFTLSNGLTIHVVENPLAPVVHHMIWYRVGAMDEATGKTGLAHYLEHLMFKGTPSVPHGAFSKAVAAHGGQDNAFTSYDYTAYHQTIASTQLGLVMQMEADRMRNLVLDPALIEPERQVVLAERQQRTDNNPRGRFMEEVRKILYLHHPYGRPVIGFEEDIKALRLQDIKAFYKKWYKPANAVVIISGDVNLPEVKRLAAGTYGRLPKSKLTQSAQHAASLRRGEARFRLEEDGVTDPLLQLYYPAPTYGQPGTLNPYAVELLVEILSAGEIGLLSKSLVVDQKIASVVEVDFDPVGRGQNFLAISLIPMPGQDLSAAELSLRQKLKELAATSITDAEITGAKLRMSRAAILARDSLSLPGHVYGQYLTAGLTVLDAESWPERIKAVKPSDIQKALQEIFGQDPYLTAMLLPRRPEGALP